MVVSGGGGFGVREGVYWWFWKFSFCLYRRISLLSVTTMFLAGQAVGIVGRAERVAPVLGVGLVLVVGYRLMGVVHTAGRGGVARVSAVRSMHTTVALCSCFVIGVLSVSQGAWRPFARSGEARVRGIVETIRRPQAGAVQFRVVGYRQRSGTVEREFIDKQPMTLLCQAADLPWRAASRLRIGDAVELVGVVQSFEEGGEASSYERSLVRAGFDGRCTVSWLTFSRGEESSPSIREQSGENLVPVSSEKYPSLGHRIAVMMTKAAGDTESVALLLSMTLGTRDRLSRDTEELFRFFGLSHLLVLSGYQLSQLIRIVGGMMTLVVAPLWRWVDKVPLYLISPIVSGGIGVLLAGVVGFEVSLVRALIGSMLVEMIRQHEGIRAMGHTLLVTALVMSALWPGMLFEPAGALTMSALFGIMVGSAMGGEGFRGVVGAHLGALICTFAVSCIWFRPPNPIAAIVAAPFAGIVAMIAFYGTLGGLGLLVTGLDGDGVCLRILAEGAEWLRSTLWWIREA